MGIEIVWTQKAVETFGKRIAYLQEHWTEKEIFNFTARVNEYLETLQTQPLMFRKSVRIKHTHIGVIIKQVSLVYRIKPKSQRIELIAFIDNRQNPRKNKS
ncbi:type II toxin-antitoxin system RelE/ParE family toxin [Mucilaginibacter lappiensis]|uniref:Plasmid stabilization system protein ParE n=1 Tax=Mucilaginibacter lappiensis TaxID=354630 RepID=A0A1N7A609_9SPHI|nr:type II toxin-antitoxin system RelE/ParE family toxin [Mucilaginibacter lappiensis]MBB6110450.1 plasmid stabilization system protein ParE [Mucilaginibacter lappiensis]MBB6128444.1 plasmid stabilization system protein ParE [Mucilaginibacter lappiensis]SIR34522.1 ParE toxin of type II toxin-antitoxin system, parDE [Mucilaginibacter lappiensis]